jgi:hypothetical protein
MKSKKSYWEKILDREIRKLEKKYPQYKTDYIKKGDK